MNKFKECIIEVVIGIRFEPKYKLLDSWGNVMDDLLANDRYFDTDFFKNISPKMIYQKNYIIQKQIVFLK